MIGPDKRPRVLYVASASVKDPLVISQVIRYLERLQAATDACHLITLEREPLSETCQKEICEELTAAGIQWHPLTSYPLLRSANIWREIAFGYRLAVRLVRRHNLNIIHARSFIPGNIGLLVKRRTGARLLYDMRGFWAIEKWTKGTIRRGWMRSVAQRMEDRLFAGADHLVSLTEAGKRRLEQRGIRTPIDVVPCCADTERFAPNGRDRRNVRQLISVGSLGPGYLPETVLQFFRAARRQWPDAQLQLLTKTPRDKIQQSAKAIGCDLEGVEIGYSNPDQVFRRLNEADVGLCFIAPSEAKIASSPTKLAEYLACGLPVVANGYMIGDVGALLAEERVGILMDDFTPDGCERAATELQALLDDPDLFDRCRRVAISRFSVDVGVTTYGQIYDRLAHPRYPGASA